MGFLPFVFFYVSKPRPTGHEGPGWAQARPKPADSPHVEPPAAFRRACNATEKSLSSRPMDGWTYRRQSPSVAWGRPRGFVALVLTFLVAALTGLVEHDHSGAVEASGYNCSVDHHAPAPSPRSGDHAGILGCGQEHRHQCVGCQLSGHKPLFAVAWKGPPGSGISAARCSKTSGLRRAPFFWMGATRRGPPTI